jgi:hypothetical protein
MNANHQESRPDPQFLPSISSMKTILLILFSSMAISCQSIEDGLNGIRPLLSTKNDVDKLYGQSKRIEPGYFQYETKDYYFEFTFTTEPCKPNDLGLGDLNVPANTVLRYTVQPRTNVKISDLKFDRKDYTKDTSGDLSGVFEYKRLRGGIVISVFEQQGIGYLREIIYFPTRIQSTKYKCN